MYYGNPAFNILASSVGVAVAAYIVGTIVGAIAQHAVDEQIQKHKRNSPIPGEGTIDYDSEDPAAASATQG